METFGADADDLSRRDVVKRKEEEYFAGDCAKTLEQMDLFIHLSTLVVNIVLAWCYHQPFTEFAMYTCVKNALLSQVS